MNVDKFAEGAQLPLNDDGNALRVTHYLGDRLRYAKTTEQWFNWDDCRWNRATNADMIRVGRVVAHYVDNETATLKDDDARKAHRTHAAKSHSSGAIKAMVDLARGDSNLWRDESEFDANPYLLNFLNGTVDLRTGRLQPHDPANWITRLVALEYDPNAKAPLWEGLVRRVVAGADRDGSGDTYRYVHAALGYSLVGTNPEHMIFFVQGPERCGKSKLVEVPRRLLGEYGHGSKTDLISRKARGHHSSETFSIIGKRFVTISETSTTFELDETEVKSLTGDADRATYRLYSGVETTSPTTWTIWLVTNDLPNVQHWDGAIAERVAIIPAGPTIPHGERVLDLDDRIIRDEAVGVLAWLVRGAFEWHRTLEETRQRSDLATTGLRRPASVMLATETYRDENDHIGQFIDEVVICDPDAATLRSAVLDRAKRWKSRGEGVVIQRNKLYSRIRALDCVSETTGREFRGIRLRPETPSEERAKTLTPACED